MLLDFAYLEAEVRQPPGVLCMAGAVERAYAASRVSIGDLCIMGWQAPSTFVLVPPLPSYGEGRDKLPNDHNGRFQPFIGIYYAANVRDICPLWYRPLHSNVPRMPNAGDDHDELVGADQRHGPAVVAREGGWHAKKHTAAPARSGVVT
jgi:hypothetical protein